MHTSIAFSLALAIGSLSLVACGGASTEAAAEAVQADDAPSRADCPSSVPAALRPAADQKLTFSFTGEGVQIYVCTATATGYAWSFKAPSAVLLSEGGGVEGWHYAGPTWEAEDGSTIVGKKVAAASPDPAAIPWLLLTAAAHGGPDGRFTRVTTVQRLNTSGGLAPATGCDATHVGDEADVPYTAGYFLYTTHARGPNAQCGQ
jgi:hypothetical protein